MGGLYASPDYGGFCVFPLNELHNYMADCAFLYLECLIGLIYHFKKLGQRDLNKKNYIKIC